MKIEDVKIDEKVLKKQVKISTPEEHISRMFEDLQEQIEDDPDIEDGKYFFNI